MKKILYKLAMKSSKELLDYINNDRINLDKCIEYLENKYNVNIKVISLKMNTLKDKFKNYAFTMVNSNDYINIIINEDVCDTVEKTKYYTLCGFALCEFFECRVKDCGIIHNDLSKFDSFTSKSIIFMHAYAIFSLISEDDLNKDTNISEDVLNLAKKIYSELNTTQQ